MVVTVRTSGLLRGMLLVSRITAEQGVNPNITGELSTIASKRAIYPVMITPSRPPGCQEGGAAREGRATYPVAITAESATAARISSPHRSLAVVCDVINAVAEFMVMDMDQFPPPFPCSVATWFEVPTGKREWTPERHANGHTHAKSYKRADVGTNGTPRVKKSVENAHRTLALSSPPVASTHVQGSRAPAQIGRKIPVEWP
jgi:hypothetical protein